MNDPKPELWAGFAESAQFNHTEFMLATREARDPRPLVALVNLIQSLRNLMVVHLAQQVEIKAEQVQFLAGANIGLEELTMQIKAALSQDETKEQTEEEKKATKLAQDRFLASIVNRGSK